MEHDAKLIPIDIRLLGALAEKCRAYAKALHYKEMEFDRTCSNSLDGSPVAAVEALIHINNQLHQHEAAVGILTYAQLHLGVQLKESCVSMRNSSDGTMLSKPKPLKYQADIMFWKQR
ncbi:hypothetical protein CASFOL_042368 [Castilleja foliolosa]|uniref:Uncharacterized protein n=1 Tax=Castilleja foliolosa TaxID=1961234 RepID=A0ABD3BAK5_9LAMI